MSWTGTLLASAGARAVALAVAYVVDRLLGDPKMVVPHPVVLMGRWASCVERWLRPFLHTARRQLAAGVLLVVLVVGMTFVVASFIVQSVAHIHFLLGIAVETWLIATTFAARGLADAALAVAQPLQGQDLVRARQTVSHIVGRSTLSLDGTGVARAAVESVAENFSDGYVAPLIYAALGGAPLALVYKAINTLDSMYGHKDEARLYFGRASAYVDDGANWIPARMSAFLLAVAAKFVGEDARGALRTAVAQGRDHPSPNAGYPEAAMAGALSVQLGGENVYPGGRSFRPYLGEAKRPLNAERVRAAVRVMQAGALVATALTVIFLLSFHIFFGS